MNVGRGGTTAKNERFLSTWVLPLAWLAAALTLSACAQPLGGTKGDPTREARAPARPAAAKEAPPSAAPKASSKAPDASNAPAAGGGTPRMSSPAPDSTRAPVDVGKARTITVGPGGDVATIAQAAKMARNGDIVEVKAGEYRGDVAVWTQKNLTIRAVGGRAVLNAAGKSAEGKGIWVIRNGRFEVEGFDFVGARVSDKNGAGIRFDHGTLVVRDSRFIDNENGILTSNDGVSTLVVERSEFAGNGHGDGYSHGIYAGRIASVEVRGSWFHDGRVGHLLKTRARENRIEYNRLTDEGGNSSYELEFPNGGRAIVVGNIIEQSAKTQNPVIVSYGAEGYKWPVNELVMSHNTLVNQRAEGGTFVRVRAGSVEATLIGNVWAGPGKFELATSAHEKGNVEVPLSALPGLPSGNYRLSTSSATRIDASLLSDDWLPGEQYLHERNTTQLTRGPLLPGAVQQ